MREGFTEATSLGITMHSCLNWMTAFGLLLIVFVVGVTCSCDHDPSTTIAFSRLKITCVLKTCVVVFFSLLYLFDSLGALCLLALSYDFILCNEDPPHFLTGQLVKGFLVPHYRIFVLCCSWMSFVSGTHGMSTGLHIDMVAAPSHFPIIEVSHLPSAASFYAASCQPLGLAYLSCSPARLHFGYISDQGPQVVFTLQQSPVIPPRPSQITLLAQSPKAVNDFYQRSLAASTLQRDPSFAKDGEETIAKTRDLDGNMLEAIYSSRKPTLEITNTAKEARRVLDWQHDVARSVAVDQPHDDAQGRSPERSSGALSRPPVSNRQPDSYTVSQPPMRLVRHDTVNKETYRCPDAGSGGFSGMKLVGTLLGAALGGAAAYAMVQADPPPPAPVRRASHDQYTPIVEQRPSRSSPTYKPEPKYVAQYTIAAAPAPMSRIEEASTSSHTKSHAARERSINDVGSRHNRALTILPRLSSKSPEAATESHASHTTNKLERRSERDGLSSHHGVSKGAESYVSARTHHTARSTTSNHGTQIQYVAEPARSRVSAGSGNSASTVRVSPTKDGGDRRSTVSARHVPLPPSVMSARNVPLPSSVMGGNYAASIAPSSDPKLYTLHEITLLRVPVP
ncbi:hypothetical protein BJ878DRAFT_523800 [Calycina marina]|uniref:Uncharacterized protein n=1 Tax=Calycina marina TaxID=1763456 RepID=A0A9P7YWV4_9HELO|nr:hypothetical protein BJ878DRAFT_523800 [Calycina marina]